MFGCNPSCGPAALLAGSWQHRWEIFQPFQKGVFLPQLDFIYDSGAGGRRGLERAGAGLGSLSRARSKSRGDVEINPVISAGAEAEKGKISPQNKIPRVFVGTQLGWMDFPRSYPKKH